MSEVNSEPFLIRFVSGEMFGEIITIFEFTDQLFVGNTIFKTLSRHLISLSYETPLSD